MNEKEVNVNSCWDIVGTLIQRSGTQEEKIAWALCRGTAAEWKMAAASSKETPK